MLAVAKAASPQQWAQFAEARPHRIRRQMPQPELAHTRRVDQIAALWQMVKLGRGGGVTAAQVGCGDRAEGNLCFGQQCLQQRGFADAGLADQKVAAPTDASYEIARRMAAEGLLVGPSAAAAVWASCQVAQGLDRGVVVTILCDSGSRYLSEHHIWGR